MTILAFVRNAKHAWHRDLASRPDTHAWVLNLYRAGERHPQTVLDYFPVDYAPSQELAEKMRRHRADEERHTRMYERAIIELGGIPEELTGLDVFNNAIRAATPTSFAIHESMSQNEQRERLAHFFAHAFFLESRVARSLEYHLEACARNGAKRVSSVVEAVHADEERHTSYTSRAVVDLLGPARGRAVLALHQRAEARANRTFSARQVQRFLGTFPNVGRKRDRFLYAASALLMQGGLPIV